MAASDNIATRDALLCRRVAGRRCRTASASRVLTSCGICLATIRCPAHPGYGAVFSEIGAVGSWEIEVVDFMANADLVVATVRLVAARGTAAVETTGAHVSVSTRPVASSKPGASPRIRSISTPPSERTSHSSLGSLTRLASVVSNATSRRNRAAVAGPGAVLVHGGVHGRNTLDAGSGTYKFVDAEGLYSEREQTWVSLGATFVEDVGDAGRGSGIGCLVLISGVAGRCAGASKQTEGGQLESGGRRGRLATRSARRRPRVISTATLQGSFTGPKRRTCAAIA